MRLAATAPTARGSQPRAVHLSALVLLVATMAVMAAASPTLAKRSLGNGSVSPRTGTTSTLFAFRVDSGKPSPTSVNARLTRGTATISVALTAPSGGSTWTRSARVATAGTWTVTFIASDGTTAPGGTITVTVPTTPRPTPTARPTPRPTAVPSTPRPATPRPSVKATATPGHSSKASATPKVSQATPPSTPVAVGGATEPSSPPGAGSSSDVAGRILPADLLGLLVILGVGGIALLTGRRQAEERPTPDPGGADQPPSPEFVRRAAAVGVAEGAGNAAQTRPRAAWEVYSSLENQPLGTVDELLPEGSTPGSVGAEDAEANAAEADGSVDPTGGDEPGAPAGS